MVRISVKSGDGWVDWRTLPESDQQEIQQKVRAIIRKGAESVMAGGDPAECSTSTDDPETDS